MLLDTHIWIWSFNESNRLKAPVLRELSNPENELWLSPISIWELFLLLDKGRLRSVENDRPESWAERALARRPMRDAALTRDVVLRGRSVSMQHADPADRFLAATANVYDLTLVTADAHILEGTGYKTLANR